MTSLLAVADTARRRIEAFDAEPKVRAYFPEGLQRPGTLRCGMASPIVGFSPAELLKPPRKMAHRS